MDSGETYPTDDTPPDPSKMSDAEWLDWRQRGMPGAASSTPPPPSSTPSGDQPTQDPIGPNTRKFLYDTISPGESSGRYDIIYGGASGPKFFNDYGQHPQQRSDIPGTGLTSDAAGRYQFLSSTWGPIAKKLGLTDFSPQSQDRAAAYLASTTYRQATGRDLETDLADPTRRSSVIAALTPQWPSLGKGGGGGGQPTTQVAQAPQRPQDNTPAYLKLMMQMLLAQRQTPRVAPADPMLAKLSLMNSLMPQQQQKPAAFGGSQFPWVNALLNSGNQSNPLQTVMNARRMQLLQQDGTLPTLT